MNIIIRIVTGVIQDHDHNSYDNVVIVYVALAAASVVVAFSMLALSLWSVDLGRLQWTKNQRQQRGHIINERRELFENGKASDLNRKVSLSCFVALLLLILGAWVAYFWGVATGHND